MLFALFACNPGSPQIPIVRVLTPDTGTPADTGTGTRTVPLCAAPGWSALPRLMAPLQENAVALLDGEVVVVGGFDDRAATVARFEAYDAARGSWRALPDLPVAIHHANVAVVDDVLYVVGSLGAAFLQQRDVWIYAADVGWSSGTPMPSDRAVGASVVGVIDGKVHVVGGTNNNRSVAWHSVYDPALDRWEALPDAPTARNHAAGGAVDGTLVVVGGRVVGLTDVLDTVERYDPASGWTVGAPMPTGRGGLAVAVLDGQLHAFGGEGNEDASTGVFDDHEAYDAALDTWTVHPPMQTPRHGTGATAVAGSVVVPGGAAVQAFGAGNVNEGWCE